MNRVLAGVEYEAAAAGLAVVITLARENHDWTSRLLRRRSAGAVVVLVDPSSSQFKALSAAGIAVVLYRWLEPAFGTDAVHQTVRFGAFTVAACQLVSNVPFVLLAGHWVPNMADPHLAWLSLALVATLAGNLTPVASVANLIVLELSGNKGKITFRRFVLVGAGATFLPLAVGLATLLAERRWGLV